MGNHVRRLGGGKLSDQEFETAKAMVLVHLAGHDSITNREIRAISQLNYDQAIICFNRMIADGLLIRIGKTTTTKYLLRAVQQQLISE